MRPMKKTKLARKEVYQWAANSSLTFSASLREELQIILLRKISQSQL